jgi:arylsulfatase A-like enzyme
MRFGWILAAFWLAFLGVAGEAGERAPNIVVILCDDLGYGDLRANEAGGTVPTPHMDRIAREGMRFTDAHAPSSVCTPTRYGLMTGRYAWRTRLQSGVLGGLSPALIEPGRATIGSLLAERGYATACVGKWHLGMGWAKSAPGRSVAELSIERPEQHWNVDYGQPVVAGPLTAGFARYFGISASLDMVPYAYFEGDRLVAVPSGDRHWGKGPGVEGCRDGPAAPGFELENVLPALAERAAEEVRRGAASGRPFFLYVALTSPHLPLAVSPEWRGKSGLGAYGDFVMATDAAVGEILGALDRAGCAGETAVVLTSDNGGSPAVGLEKLAAKGHAVNGPLRGHKGDLYEGGHRVPFAVRWPARVQPGVSDGLVCLTDLFATCAEWGGAAYGGGAGEDSVSMVPLLERREGLRQSVVHHSIKGRFAFRRGPWKLLLSAGSGGWGEGKGAASGSQLYRVGEGDLAERRDVFAEHPEIARDLETELERQLAAGRSAPGEGGSNAVAVRVRP